MGLVDLAVGVVPPVAVFICLIGKAGELGVRLDRSRLEVRIGSIAACALAVFEVVSECRDIFLRFKHFAADRALLAVGKTFFGTGCSFAGNDFFHVLMIDGDSAGSCFLAIFGCDRNGGSTRFDCSYFTSLVDRNDFFIRRGPGHILIRSVFWRNYCSKGRRIAFIQFQFGLVQSNSSDRFNSRSGNNDRAIDGMPVHFQIILMVPIFCCIHQTCFLLKCLRSICVIFPGSQFFSFH